MTPSPTGDALVQSNQAQAASMGIAIPGVGGKENTTPPSGWDATTYANFKAANPTLEPTIQDTSIMQGASSAPAGTPPVVVPSTVSSTGLKSSAPASITGPAPTTGNAGVQGYLAATSAQNADTYQKSLDTAAEAAKTNDTSSFSDYINQLSGNVGTAQATDTAYKATVDPAKTALNEINNKIIADQVSTRHEIETLKANPQGLVGDALNQKIQDINDKATSRQADLAVIQLSKQGQYDSAKTIADRAVAALTEQEKNKIAAAQATYENNKSLFTTAEQRAFENQQNDRKNALDLKTYELKAKFDETIHNEEAATAASKTSATANQADDVAQAILDFQNQIQNKGWAGANPDAYNHYKTQLVAKYGANAALELDKAMAALGITVG